MIPSIAPSPAATPKPKDYLPPLARRPRPHIRGVVLSPELTQQLSQRNRKLHPKLPNDLLPCAKRADDVSRISQRIYNE